MTPVAVDHALILSGILFTIGIIGLLVRRNIIFMLISVEIMLNASGMAFITAGARWNQPDGQVMFIFILTMAAAEVAVGLALLLNFYRFFQNLNADSAQTMKG